MENRGWNSRWTSDLTEGLNDPRWIVIRDSSGNLAVRKTVAHIAKEIRDQSIPVINDTWSLDQWHIRTFNIDGADDEVDVVGQVHHDPWDHGKFTVKDVGIEGLWTFSTQKPDWAFSTARQLVSDDWRSWGSDISTIDIGNGGKFPTSSGKMDKIYQP